MVLSNEEQGGTEVRESIVKKAYYSIGEVCDLTALKPHVLRYWETQFDVLRPTKNRAGNRVFRPKDIELVLLVKNLLYAQKYTIEGANQKLLEMRREGKLEESQHGVLEPEFLATMTEELDYLAKVLDPAEPLHDLPESGGEDPGSIEVDPEAEGDPEAGEVNPEAGEVAERPE